VQFTSAADTQLPGDRRAAAAGEEHAGSAWPTVSSGATAGLP